MRVYNIKIYKFSTIANQILDLVFSNQLNLLVDLVLDLLFDSNGHHNSYVFDVNVKRYKNSALSSYFMIAQVSVII